MIRGTPDSLREDIGGKTRELVVDLEVREILVEILTVLKRIEYHQYLATDTELKDQDV